METRLNMIEAAWNVGHDCRLFARTWPDIVKDMERLSSIAIPWSRKLAVTVQFLKEVADNPQPEMFVGSLWPENLLDEVAWCAQEPKLGHLMTEAKTGDAAAKALFQDQLMDAFFCSKVLVMVSDIDKGNNAHQLREILVVLLDFWNEREDLWR